MDRTLILACDAAPAVRLRSIAAADLEALRLWKNANRQAFFFKDEITPAMQKEWFAGYLARPEDFMFMVESAAGERSGCMGFRLRDGAADCYNIIGDPASAGTGRMAAAMRLMCSRILAAHTRAVGLRVLKDNPAALWYERKCRFRRVGEGPDYFQLELDLESFEPCAFREETP